MILDDAMCACVHVDVRGLHDLQDLLRGGPFSPLCVSSERPYMCASLRGLSDVCGRDFNKVHLPRSVSLNNVDILASSRLGRDSIQYRVGKTHCQGHQDPSKRVPIFPGTPEALIKMVPISSVPITSSISRWQTVACSG